MPYISTPEHLAEERGLRRGIEAMHRVRFGSEGLRLMPEINQVFGEETLRAILDALETAKSPDEVRRLWENAK